MTLADYFKREFAPVFLCGASAGTFAAYQNTLAVWRAVMGDGVALEAIDVRLLAEFKRRVAERCGRGGRPRSPATTNRDLRHLLHLLAKAGPPGHRNRDALGLLPSAPWTRPVQTFEDLPREISLDQIAAVYRGAAAASGPRFCGVSPEAWWQGLIVAAYNLAARLGHLRSLTWSDVDLAGGWLVLRWTGDKRRRSRRKPINDTLRRHLLRLRTGGDRVFPWYANKCSFYYQWRKILRASGLPASERIWPHDLKRAAATEASAVADPFAVQTFCDHRSLKTTTEHYINASGRLMAVSEHLRQPAAFQAAGDPQRMLFAM